MKKDGIIIIENGVKRQLLTGLTFREAFSKCTDLRALKDGNYYYIGNL